MDYLTEDSITPKNQNYVCLSFLTPSDEEKNLTLSGIKIRGVFNTYEEACKHAKLLQSVDEYFNVFVGEVGKWLPFDPSPDSEFVKDSEYANEKLNIMMKAYKENQEKAKLYHELQKNEQMKKNITENMNQTIKNKEELENQMDNTNKESLLKNLESIKEQIKKMEERKTDLEKMIKGLKNKLDLNQ